MELLAPAGDFKKLKTAFHFGADAAYVGGNNYGLRQNAVNFNNDELTEAVKYAHERGKKLYVTCNIVAHNEDFAGLTEYLQFLDGIGIDGLIIADLGIFALARKVVKNAELHVSTQANVTNRYAAEQWIDMGADRIVTARELSCKEIREIRDSIPDNVSIEAFVHGAMCISHSGRCLLSNFLAHRDGNRGACVQACRWEYSIYESSRPNAPLTITEDERGSYLLNSKDLNMLKYMDKVIEAGVDSFKIEGRIKSQYYVGTVVNAYRQALNSYIAGKFFIDEKLENELKKTNHRQFTTGFYFGEYDSVSYNSSQSSGDSVFIAEVLDYDESKGALIIEQRNRFGIGDELEILSADSKMLNQKIIVNAMTDEDGNTVNDAKNVQQRLLIYTDKKLRPMDILRIKRDN